MIRLATELDIPRLAILAQEYAHEGKDYDSFPFDLGVTLSSLAMAFTLESHCIFVAIHDNQIVGAMWGCVNQVPWSTAIMATDNILYVTPERRGYADGVRLLRHYEHWAKAKGASVASISVASGITMQATGKLYERVGYSYIGSHYRKEI